MKSARDSGLRLLGGSGKSNDQEITHSQPDHAHRKPIQPGVMVAGLTAGQLTDLIRDFGGALKLKSQND
jgi:hypothetical protein